MFFALMTLIASLVSAKPAAVGMIPFVAVTGRPTEAEVRAKVAAIKAQGMDSFFVYARSGLEYEYMGEDWLKTVETFCDEASRRNLKVWLYDEYNWPSGTCKGRVPRENPDWRYREYGVFPDGKGGFRWEIGYGPNGWVNVCEAAAVDRFIELTHDVYAKRLSRYFADGTVVGIFTDEPGHEVEVDFASGKPIVSFRCFTGLEDDYRAKTGRELKADVERWLRDRSDENAAVWSSFAEVFGRRFRTAYFDRIREWCDRHGILFTGHLIAEQQLANSADANGDPMLCLRGESLPGMDEIRTAFEPDGEGSYKIEWVTYNLARQAILHRGNGGLVELFACGPADIMPCILRKCIWVAALHGIDRYLTCMDVMDERGLVEKHAYLSPTGPLHPWYSAQSKLLADDCRVAAKWARKTISRREVAVRYPNRASAITAFSTKLNGNKIDETKAPKLFDLLKMLELNQFTCRFIDESSSSDLPLIFGCNADGSYFEERTDAKRLTAAEALAKCRALPFVFAVLEPNGSPARDVLLREYSDGSAAIVNMCVSGERSLLIERNGVRSPVVMQPNGILLLEQGELPRSSVRKSVASLADTRWQLSLDRPNLLRVNFDAEKRGIVDFSADIEGIRPVTRDLAMTYAVTTKGRAIGLYEEAPKGVKVLRHDAVPYLFSVDGQTLDSLCACNELPCVYNPLYRTAPARSFAAGRHEFRIESGEADVNYFLPALFLYGNFRMLDGKLSPPSSEPVAFGTLESLGYGSFIGKATWTADVQAPEGATAIRVDTGSHVTSVRFCGRDLGVKAWGPFEFELPPDLLGRPGKLEISLWTSAQPMYGDETAAKWDTRFWLRVHTPGIACGLLSAEWSASR